MINEAIARPAPELVQGFRDLLVHDSITCALSDCMGRLNAMTALNRGVAGATIGELVNVDELMRSTFSYQDRALKRD